MNVRFFLLALAAVLIGPDVTRADSPGTSGRGGSSVAAVRGDSAARADSAGPTPLAAPVFSSSSAAALRVGDSTAATTPSLRSDTTWVLPGITVTATRVPTPGQETPIRIHRLDRAAIERSGTGDLAELLTARGTTFLKSRGPTGLSTPTLRGTGASQSLLLLDGQPLRHPQIGHVDLSLLPTALMQSVEVSHGGGSSLYGSSGIGGATHVRSLDAGEAPPIQTRLGWGAFGQRTASLTSAARSEEVSAVGAIRYRHRDGDFPYRNASLVPPRTVRRGNADRTEMQGFLRLHGPRGPDPWAGGVWIAESERGVPGPATGSPAPARQRDGLYRAWGHLRVHPMNRSVTLRSALQHQVLTYRDSSIGLDATGRTWTVRTSAEHSWSPSGEHQLSAGLSAAFDRAEHPSLAGAARRGELGIHASGRLAWNRLILYPSVRLDGYLPWGADHQTSAPVSPQIGLNYRLTSEAPLRWKARIGRAYRVPTLNDRYWQPGGNPELAPERGWTADTGVLYGHSRFRAEFTAFVSRLRDRIEWQPTGRGYWAPLNLGVTRTRGLEASIRSRLPIGARHALRGSLFYSWTRAENRTDPGSATYGEQLRYVPVHLARAQIGATVRTIELTLRGRYVGRRFVTSDGSEALEPFLRMDASIGGTHRIGPVRLRTNLTLENALDTEYALVNGYPMPPRHVTLDLTMSWAPSSNSSNASN